jgi:hypothetical protein
MYITENVQIEARYYYLQKGMYYYFLIITLTSLQLASGRL